MRGVTDARGVAIPDVLFTEDAVEVRIGRSAGFVDPPYNPSGYTLSESLKHTKWKNLLPPPEIFAPYVESRLKGMHQSTNTGLNIFNIFVSLLYLTAAFGLGGRAVQYLANPRLRDETPVGEHIRTFTDVLGYFTAPFLITIVTAIVNLIAIYKTNQKVREDFTKIMSDYEGLRNAFIDKHRKMGAFFLIAETIASLPTDETVGANLTYYTSSLEAFRTKITRRLGKIGIIYDFRQSLGLAPAQFPLPSIVRTRLADLLTSSPFLSIFEEIKKYVKRAINHDRDFSSELRVSLCYRIDHDPALQLPLAIAIGNVAITRRHHQSSEILRKIELTGETTLDSIRHALNEYWNDPSRTQPLIYPYDTDPKELGMLVHLQLRSTQPGLMQCMPLGLLPPPTIL